MQIAKGKLKTKPPRSVVARRGANGQPHKNGQGKNGRHVAHDPAGNLHPRPRRKPPRPVYHGQGITLYRGDCLDVLADLPAGSVDTVITDPPYHLSDASRNGSPRVPGTGPCSRFRGKARQTIRRSAAGDRAAETEG